MDNGWATMVVFVGAIIIGFGLSEIYPPLAIVYSGAILVLFGLAGLEHGS